jgi:ABC-type transport system substrate-binding protein
LEFQGTDWTIPLRENIWFHDGTKFNATAVKWNLDRINYFASNRSCTHSSLWFNAQMARVHTLPRGPEKQALLDTIVYEIIVEQAVAFYFQQDALYPVYSSYYIDPESTSDLFNPEGDVLFYNLRWNPGKEGKPWLNDIKSDSKNFGIEIDIVGTPPMMIGLFAGFAIIGVVITILKRKNFQELLRVSQL